MQEAAAAKDVAAAAFQVVSDATVAVAKVRKEVETTIWLARAGAGQLGAGCYWLRKADKAAVAIVLKELDRFHHSPSLQMGRERRSA